MSKLKTPLYGLCCVLPLLLQFKPQLFFFYLTSNQKFDIFIMLIILLNMMTMAIEHYDQPDDLEMGLLYVNQVFIVIFTCECIMKLLALRQYYFKQPWNVFDFIVVISSVLGEPRFISFSLFSVQYTVVVMQGDGTEHGVERCTNCFAGRSRMQMPIHTCAYGASTSVWLTHSNGTRPDLELA